MKKVFIFISVILFSISLNAQNGTDAFRFSYIDYYGTARTMAMANSFGALGADLSMASVNTAGIGMFSHSGIVFTPGLMMGTTRSQFAGTETEMQKLSFLMSNFGFYYAGDERSDMRFNFAFGYNRTKNFTHNFYYTGVNNAGSIMDYFMNAANGYYPDELDEFSTYGAWQTFLIDTVTGDPTHYTNPLWWTQPADSTPKYGENVYNKENIRGGMGEYFITGAWAYKDIFYVGITIGIPTINYSFVSSYSEENFEDNPDLKSLSYERNLTDNGTGVNFKIGLIARPVSFIRIAAAYHSPAYFSIDDKYNTTTSSYWNTPDTDGNYDYSYVSETNLFKYNLITPQRFYLDAAATLNNYLAINLGYENIDYRTMKLNSDSYPFKDENDEIKNTYAAVDNYKIGVEVGTEMIKFRVGYALFGNPYNKKNIVVKKDFDAFYKSQMSFGLGIRKGVNIDIAYVKSVMAQNEYFYNGYLDEPVPKRIISDGMLVFSLGFNF